MNKIKNIIKYVLIGGATGALLLSAAFISAQSPNLDKLKQNAQSRAQQAKQQLEQIRSQAQAQAKQIRDNVKQKISQIKDNVKQDSANKIADQFDRVNQVWTDHFTNVLDQLDIVLQKIKSRAGKASANGQDVSAANTAIQNAETAIATARTAVANQTKKTYVVDTTVITGTTSTTSGQNNLVSKFRAQFKALRDSLFTDLKALRDGAVKDARTSIQNASQALSQVPDVDKEPAQNSNNQ